MMENPEPPAELGAFGFTVAGRYRDGAFVVAPEWRGRQVVYVWSRNAGHEQSVLRVGVAYGEKGFGRRYDHYNRWLAGRFKPDDPREQKVRALFLSRLTSDCMVWAREIADKAQALAVENDLRAYWGARLELDLMAKGSWAKLEMQTWRRERSLAGSASGSKSSYAADERSHLRKQAITGGYGEADVIALHRRLEARLIKLGLTPSPVQDGVSYKLGRASLCRSDPKREFLRVQVGVSAERAAPAALRGPYRQDG